MAENNWAIVIGINAYEFLPADDHLKYAVNDAVKVRQFLCEQAKFPEENVLLCCDSASEVSPKQRPNRNGLRHLLKNEIQRAKGANNFWFFYAGHGIVHEQQDFLLPCDGNPRDLRDTAIPISFVTDCLRDCGAHNVVLVMDMCRNRTQGTDEGSRDIGEVMGEQIQQIAKEQGIVTLFSCSRGERSYEIGDLGQGAFTYALLEGLQQNTTPRALEQYLTQRVPALNLQHGKNIQMPRVIPEPGLKYDRPLLLSCATPADIFQLAVEAMNAELEEQDYEKAKALWWQVIEADRSTQSDRAKARKAIDRINNITAGAYEQRRAEEEQKKAAERQRELERQQELGQQRQEQLKQEVAAKQRQVEEQERQRQELERQKQAEAERQRLAAANQQKQPATPVNPSQTDRDDLSSERFGANYYARLHDLLAAKDWKAADKETYDRMREVMERRLDDGLSDQDIQKFPCLDLRNIDRLWVEYSKGKFGFSVQKEIWQSCGSPKRQKGKTGAYFAFTDNKDWVKFALQVGWRTKGLIPWTTDEKFYWDFTFDLTAPSGHLPRVWRGEYGAGGYSPDLCILFSRVKNFAD